MDTSKQVATPMATDFPQNPADALDALEILMRAYVPKNTSDAKFCLAALNVLRRAELSTHAGDLLAALKTISETTPRTGLDPSAKVGDPNAVAWNVHRIARAAIRRATGE